LFDINADKCKLHQLRQKDERPTVDDICSTQFYNSHCENTETESLELMFT